MANWGWFTGYTGDTWNVRAVNQQLSKHFRDEIDELCKQLNLKGPDGVTTKGFPKKGHVSYGAIRVVIKSFTFDGYRKMDTDFMPYYTPVWNFDIKLMAKRWRARSNDDLEEVYNGRLEVTFENDYPRGYPVFRIPRYFNYRPAASHDDHMFRGGKMCLYADTGRNMKAWDRDRDNVAAAFGVAMRWLVWHERDKPRYGVDADDVNRA